MPLIFHQVVGQVFFGPTKKAITDEFEVTHLSRTHGLEIAIEDLKKDCGCMKESACKSMQCGCRREIQGCGRCIYVYILPYLARIV